MQNPRMIEVMIIVKAPNPAIRMLFGMLAKWVNHDFRHIRYVERRHDRPFTLPPEESNADPKSPDPNTG